MKIKKNNIYVDSEGSYYKAAMTGNFYIVDMWKCDKSGCVDDIEQNPYPVPINTVDLKHYGVAVHEDDYPPYNPQF